MRGLQVSEAKLPCKGLTSPRQSLPQQLLCRGAFLPGLLVQLSAVHPLPLMQSIQSSVALRLETTKVFFPFLKSDWDLVTCNTHTHTHTLELRRVTEAPRSTKICATSKLPQKRASWSGVTPSHRGPPASLMLAPWSNRTATISGRRGRKMTDVLNIQSL